MKRDNSYYANHPQCLVHLVMLKISVGRDPKNPTTSSTAQIQLSTVFSKSSNSQPISSGHDVIHTPASFPVWRFITTMVIVISFECERKSLPNDYAPELLTRIVQSPTKQ